MVRNRARHDSGVIHFRFDFGSLAVVGLQRVARMVRYWFDFDAVLVRFCAVVRKRDFGQD